MGGGEAQGTGGQCDASASKGGSGPPTRDFTQLALLSAHFLHGEFFFNSICKRESVPFRKERQKREVVRSRRGQTQLTGQEGSGLLRDQKPIMLHT